MRYKATSDGVFGCEMDFNKFSKTTAVVVSRSFSISKSFQKWISCVLKKNVIVILGLMATLNQINDKDSRSVIFYRQEFVVQ